jgi:hypothetical protein
VPSSPGSKPVSPLDIRSLNGECLFSGLLVCRFEVRSVTISSSYFLINKIDPSRRDFAMAEMTHHRSALPYFQFVERHPS